MPSNTQHLPGVCSKVTVLPIVLQAGCPAYVHISKTYAQNYSAQLNPAPSKYKHIQLANMHTLILGKEYTYRICKFGKQKITCEEGCTFYHKVYVPKQICNIYVLT